MTIEIGSVLCGNISCPVRRSLSCQTSLSWVGTHPLFCPGWKRRALCDTSNLVLRAFCGSVLSLTLPSPLVGCLGTGAPLTSSSCPGSAFTQGTLQKPCKMTPRDNIYVLCGLSKFGVSCVGLVFRLCQILDKPISLLLPLCPGYATIYAPKRLRRGGPPIGWVVNRQVR